MSLVVPDTDAASALLRRRASAALLHIVDDSIPAVTFVTVGELTKWTLIRHWGPIRRDHVRTFLDAMVTCRTTVLSRRGGAAAQAYAAARSAPPGERFLDRCLLPGA